MAGPDKPKRVCADLALHRHSVYKASNVVSKRQRGNILDGTGCQYFPYRVCEFQRYRHAIAKNAGVVVEFGEGKNVLQHHIDIRVTFINVDD